MAPLYINRDVDIEAKTDSGRMLGPTALKISGREKGWKSSSGYEGLSPDNLFSQNSCRGFSSNDNFLSALFSFARDLWIWNEGIGILQYYFE